MGVYPGNTISNYITKLSRDVNQTGDWEVSLNEIQYPRTWYNVQEGQQWIYYRRGPRDMFNAHKIPIGHYSTVQELIGAIQSVIDGVDSNRNVLLSYDGIMNRVRIMVKNGGAISMKDDLATMLGYESPLTSPITTSFSAPYAPNLQLGMHSLYVYCSLVQDQMVGDVQVPLLRIIPVEGQHGEFITKSYQSPQYLPLSRKSFDSIEIDIKDDTGRNIPFESGKSVVTLHFRLKRSPYFN